MSLHAKRLPPCVFGLFLALISLCSVATAQTGVWKAGGPAPSREGQVENITNREVVGAVHAVAPHPTNANTIYIGSVNGGVWRTDDALAASPNWAAQTDQQNSLSIGALEFDPTDRTNQTIVAGIGRFSNIGGGAGGARSGILRTTDGGTTWVPLGQVALNGTNISGVAARGAVIVVSGSVGGIWRSIDTGTTWTQISGLPGSGLPAGASFDLEGVPGAPTTLYTNAGSNGIYRSNDTGATWNLISTAAMNAFAYSNARISTLAGNTVYVAIANGGQLGGVFQSLDGGVNWTAMGVPLTNEGGLMVGLHPGGQAGVNLSMVADPNAPNGNIIYVGGDRQPNPFPNSIGAQNFSGRLFRAVVTAAAGTQWAHLTHSNSQGAAGGGTRNNSAPHADSRNMEVDALGNLLEVDDGGIYRRSAPMANQGVWTSVNGNLQNTEFHSVAWDAVSNLIIGGAQDVGTPEQREFSNRIWRDVTQADGGVVAVDDNSTPGLSNRFSSSQNLGALSTRTFDVNNNLVAQVPTALVVLSGGAAIAPQFYTPIVVNNANGARMVIGAQNSVYEFLDSGATVTEIGVGISVNSALQGEAIAYGAADNANMLYVGSGAQVFVRSAAHPASLLTASPTYPGALNVIDVTIDPTTAQTAYVIDRANVFQTTDGGANWTNITGDLIAGFNPGQLRSVDVFSIAGQHAVIVGTDRGVYWADRLPLTEWFIPCDGLPNAPVTDLEFDEQDEVLLAGTLGRGAWTCAPAKPRGTEYRVKFVCGKGQGPVLAQGIYTTAINIINRDAPDAPPGNYRRSFSIGLPGETIGGQSASSAGPTLAPGEAVEIDCEDIVREVRTFCPEGLCKGFASIDSEVPLDIVAVYSAEDPNTGSVTDLTTDRVTQDGQQCAETTLTIPASTRLFVPPHRQGDREFDGNGPCVRFSLDLRKVDNETALAAVYSMHAYECAGMFQSPQSDFTAAQGERFEIIASAGAGGRILGYSTLGTMPFGYVDTDHADDPFLFTNNEPVTNLRFVGDTSGDESGTETGVLLTFRPIDVRMQTCSIPSDAG